MLRHKSRLDSILADFAYASHCVLVVQAEFAAAQRPGWLLHDIMRASIAHWDAALLLYEDVASAPALAALNCTTLAPRIAFSPASGNVDFASALWALQIGRLLSSSESLPRPSQAHIPALVWQRLQGLPPAWQNVVRTALSNPSDWDSDRIAAGCCTTRRTLERRMRRVGLPGPAALLRLAR